MPKKILSYIIVLLYTCLVGCSNTAVEVQIVDPEKISYGTETLDLRNCDSDESRVTTLAAEAPVRRNISIDEQATVVDTGSTVDIPIEILDQLKLQVEGEYQSVFQEAVAGTEIVELMIPGHMIHMHKIHWIKQIYQSNVYFSIENQQCTSSYVYTLEIPELDSTTIMSCTA